jgi:hypothetical protein
MKSESETLSKRSCGAMPVLKRQIRADPERKKIRQEIEQYSHLYSKFRKEEVSIVTIPVVVHVVYKNQIQNINEQQISSQIAVLNTDYSMLNSDISKAEDYRPLAVDTKIHFKLATRDPNGNPTTGITRTSTNVSSFTFDDKVKSASTGGKDPWDTSSYLNMWVCALSGGLLGYAQFPGMDPATDGVVINYRAFGVRGAGGQPGTAQPPFDLGRTATHEVGHWLNLLHIWGDDDGGCDQSDEVDDTPNQADKNFGKPAYPHITCNNGPHGDMFMNYMDYVDDDSMVMFSRVQGQRMQAALSGPRVSILSSQGILPTSRREELTAMRDKEVGTKTRKHFNGYSWE